MLKCLVLLTAATGSLAANRYFNCTTSGKVIEYNHRKNTTVNEATCCRAAPVFVPTCGENTVGAPFVCPANEWVDWGNRSKESPNATKCCSAITTSCGSATGHATGSPSMFACPATKVFNQSTYYTPNPTEGTCCMPFTPTCVRKTSTCVYSDNNQCLDLFSCSDGTTLNSTAYEYPSPDQNICCQPFTATCGFNSGPVLGKLAYTCPTGMINNGSAGNENSTEAACCMSYTKNCAQTNDAGDRLACPAGKKETEYFNETPPSADVCCEPATCEQAYQATCATEAATNNCQGNRLVDSTKNAFAVHYGNYDNVCCKIKPAVVFSAGYTLGAASSLGLLSALLLL